MIPILYRSSETAFDTNGIGALTDAVWCRVVEFLNGRHELSLRYPLKGIHRSALTDRAIILAKPNPYADPQPYRIYNRTPSSQGHVTVRARHLAYDLMGCVVSPFRAVGAPAALAALKANSATECPFSFWTDKSADATMTVTKPASIWSLLGGSKGSVLDCFGGEYEFDRFLVKLWTRRGSDNGVSIRYGKNLISLEQDENCANCYTGIFPFWASADETAAEVVLLPERIVHAAGKYDHVRILPVDFSYEWTETPTENVLRARAEQYITDNQIGVPDVSLRVQHVSLDQTAEYADRIPLERVSLGDTVYVEFPEMDVAAKSRIIATEFDVLNEEFISTTVGSVKANISSTIAQQLKENQTKTDVGMSQHIAAQLAAAIMGARGGAARMLDTNGDGLPDEIYIADNQDPAQAVKVWRWNYQGWAASKTGYNGPFVFGATFEDGLMAHVVKAANLIAGTISSKDGNTFFLDLDNGILRGNFKDLQINSQSVGDSLNSLSNQTTALSLSSSGILGRVEEAEQQLREKADGSQLNTVRSDVTTLRQKADGLDLTVQTLSGTVAGKADKEALTEVTEHFRFALDGMTISNTATGMGINVSEQQVAFIGGQDPTTIIRPNDMETTNLQVKTQLDLGGFSFIPRSNQNLSLRWTGGNT